MLIHYHDCGFTVPFLFSISKQNLLSGCWLYAFARATIGCRPLWLFGMFEEERCAIELKDLREVPGMWLLVSRTFEEGMLDELWQSILHLSYLSPGFLRVTNSIKGWKVVLYFSLMIFFLNLITDGSTINLGSVAKHVTTLFSESFLIKFYKYSGS